LIDTTRTTVEVLVAMAGLATAADVVGGVVVEDVETGRVVVTGSVDGGAITTDVIGCVGSGPSSTVRDTVLDGAVLPAVTVAHPVAPRITASMQHTREPVIPDRIRPTLSAIPSPPHDRFRQEVLKVLSMMPKVLSTLPVADASSTET
jgi:hypothetical protein